MQGPFSVPSKPLPDARPKTAAARVIRTTGGGAGRTLIGVGGRGERPVTAGGARPSVTSVKGNMLKIDSSEDEDSSSDD